MKYFLRIMHLWLLEIIQKAKNGKKMQRETFLSDEGPPLETLDFTIRIGSTPTSLYFDLSLLCLRSTVAHYVYKYKYI